MRNMGMIWFLVNLLFGLYLLNFGLKFIVLSFISDSINNWIIILGGGLIILHGVMSLTKKPAYPPRYR